MRCSASVGSRWRTTLRQLAELRPAFETAAGVCCEARLLPGAHEAAANPYQGLNAGIVEIYRSRGRWDVRVRLVGEGEDAEHDTAIVYDTGTHAWGRERSQRAASLGGAHPSTDDFDRKPPA